MEEERTTAQLAEDIEIYSIADLELILQTQKELYSAEELAVIKETLERKKQEMQMTAPEYNFCLLLFCIVGLVTPLSGLITGIIMLIKGNFKNMKKWRSIGVKTLLASLISVLIRLFMQSGGFHV